MEAQKYEAPGGSSHAISVPVWDAEFEVISIKPVAHPDPRNVWGVQPGVTKDGYYAKSQSLWATIMLAFYQTSPSPLSWKPSMLQGAPDWLMKSQYEISAKIAPENLARWQKPDPDKFMLRTAMQKALQERCRLVLHRTTTVQSVYALVIKDPAKLKLEKATSPDKFPPDAARIENFGATKFTGSDNSSAQFYATSMKYLAAYISITGADGRQIIDKTGLSGVYDFLLPGRPSGEQSNDVFELPWDLEELGLTLKPMKAPVETLVIEHIEEPIPN